MAQAQCNTLLPARRPFAPPQGCSGQWLGLRWRSAQATPLLRCAPPLGSLRRPHSPSPSELGSQSALHPPTPAPGRLLRCAPPPANPYRYRVIGLPRAPPVWYSSVALRRSPPGSPAHSTSHTGGSPSHSRISQADAPPLPASASATFASLALRSGLRAVRCAHSRHSRSCEHNRSSFRPLRSAMWAPHRSLRSLSRSTQLR